eukprot:CAMPEP_0183384008 /NCGR_PEP_ID=MMETSP0370-20130417/186_1 /TAXON_ID=268820 /ORGANISM="Peridinium aciculiferum, Strain PAER-2" /LENGTH=123 /DNA_ID=CAMNT_0025561677 /DNA_START=102 /DNA_END=469 /DNA_ORIENTATION=-
MTHCRETRKLYTTHTRLLCCEWGKEAATTQHMWRDIALLPGKTKRIGPHLSISRRTLACASGEGAVAMRLVAVAAHARRGARAIATLLHAMVAAAHNEVAEAAAATLRDTLQVLHALSCCWHR